VAKFNEHLLRFFIIAWTNESPRAMNPGPVESRGLLLRSDSVEQAERADAHIGMPGHPMPDEHPLA
jgi:hypothetical protein